jgi:hypothetical protein
MGGSINLINRLNKMMTCIPLWQSSCGDIIPTIGTSLKSSRRDEYSNI